MDRDRKAELAELQKSRKTDTQPSRPLERYAGRYISKLYSDLTVTAVDGRLRVQLGDYAATLEHWHDDTFYGRAVIEPFLDWLVTFDLDQRGCVNGLEIVNVGWKDPDERFLFERPAD
jgi:hypothetical protein